MRLIHAITAADLRDNGMDYPYGPAQVWKRILKTPAYMYATLGNGAFAVQDGLMFRGGYFYFTLPVGQQTQSWKPNEVLACGYYITPSSGSAGEFLRNHNSSGLIIASKNGSETLCTWAEIFPYTDGGSASFIEFRISYDRKTAWVVVNGREVKTVALSGNCDPATMAMYFHPAPGVTYGNNTINNIYAAYFDPAVEKPYLGRWNCEALVISASELPGAADDGGAVDVLTTSPKVIEFTYAGTAKPKAAMVSAYAWGSMAETLEVKLKSGATETTLITTNTPDEVGLTSNQVGANLAYGMLVGSVDFDNTSKKVTATLKLNK